jgi:NADH-quinone oxidoreductase subunit J
MELFFYLFSFLLITSAIGVIASNNPVYSVLWLIFSFCNASGLFVLLGAEFLAFTLVIVYVGAVAVLFLFVVMMLDIDIATLKTSFARNWPIALFFLVFFAIDLIAIVLLGLKAHSGKTLADLNHNLGSIYNIGQVLYTKYMLPFQLSGVVLLVAMIGCITLTLRHTTFVKRQDPRIQNARSKENSMDVVKVKSKMGVKGLTY